MNYLGGIGQVSRFMPPPVMQSDEEPTRRGRTAYDNGAHGVTRPTADLLRLQETMILPPLVTQSGEEPIAMGGWYF